MTRHAKVAALAGAVVALSATGATIRGQGEGSKLQNPTKATAASIAAGQKTYNSQCLACHGTAGKGDGKAAANLTPKPSDLTDATWTHGSSDGEIFVVVRDGVMKTGMKGYASKMTATEMWNVVNFVRSLAANAQ
jgi:mono/diheme cytochrome c family protein